MEKTAQEAKLKDGSTVGYTNVNGEHIFINTVISRWYLMIIIFITIISILLVFVQMDFQTQGYNAILKEIAELREIISPSGIMMGVQDESIVGQIESYC